MCLIRLKKLPKNVLEVFIYLYSQKNGRIYEYTHYMEMRLVFLVKEELCNCQNWASEAMITLVIHLIFFKGHCVYITVGKIILAKLGQGRKIEHVTGKYLWYQKTQISMLK